MVLVILMLVILRTVEINTYITLSNNAVYVFDAIWHQMARGLPQCNKCQQ